MRLYENLGHHLGRLFTSLWKLGCLYGVSGATLSRLWDVLECVYAFLWKLGVPLCVYLKSLACLSASLWHLWDVLERLCASLWKYGHLRVSWASLGCLKASLWKLGMPLGASQWKLGHHLGCLFASFFQLSVKNILVRKLGISWKTFYLTKMRILK